MDTCSGYKHGLNITVSRQTGLPSLPDDDITQALETILDELRL